MQAISVAIGKAGIQLFAQHIVAAHVIDLLKTLPAPDRSIPVGGRWDIPCNQYETQYEVRDGTFSIALNGGVVQNLDAKCTAVEQDPNDNTIFQCTFVAGAFSVQYNWTENYVRDTYSYLQGIGWVPDRADNISNRFNYAPGFNGLTLKVKFQFKYDAGAGWEMVVQGKPEISTTETSANIPAGSAVLYSGSQCNFGNSASDATVQALQNIDFNGKVGDVVKGVIASIPTSGELGDGIRYDFSSGDDGLKFPAANSIQMGVKGGASYNGTAFSGTTPPALPLPAPLPENDIHHLDMYVSNYEVDALNWAFFKAGRLDTVVNAADLPDPDVLKVKTYVSILPALKPFASFAMQAQISLNSAPTTSFQLVYELTTEVLNTLKLKVSQQVYQLLTGLQGNNYVSKVALETDLSGAGIDSSNFSTIEMAAQSMGMVVGHDIHFTLVIQNFQSEQPQIVFNVKRTDILGNLALGVGPNKTQTMQFGFKNANWTAGFVSSTIPKFDGSSLAMVWGTAGEPRYDNLLAALGATGVPIPIMQGFKFDFTNAELNMEENYVSIKACVEYS
ncbi:MAG: hypothetical protein JNL02_14235 [Saprospiraceae bacterium]|nr:hypothetical protein [Saprospiraceae bacterium]